MEGVTLAVLGGGAGVRMGRPKTALRVRGKPILVDLMERMKWAGPTMLVTSPGREKPAGAGLFAREVCDAVADEGPMRGLVTLLGACATEMVVVIPVDMPGLERGHLEQVVGMLTEDESARGMLLSRAGRVEPFPSAWRRSVRGDVERHFQMGERAMRSLAGIAGVRVRAALEGAGEWGDAVWKNVNRPGDWTGDAVGDAVEEV